MSCRVACQPDPPLRHWPTFSRADLPAGQAECLMCGDWITMADFLSGACAGTTEGVSDGNTHGGRTGVGPGAANPPEPADDERAATIAMVQRCGAHQR